MATTPEYKAYIVDLLTEHYPVTTRNMFGGVGIYCEDGMFGLISSDDVLYLKVDAQNRDDFVTREMSQFMTMPYFELPVDILESSEDLGQWVQNSVTVAQRAPKKKKKKK